MDLSESISINKSRQEVWPVITDFEHLADLNSGIISAQVLEKPAEGLVGLKWTETREMFGKEASETMWITEAVDNEYYCTRAESHGSVYLTRVELKDGESGSTTMTMSFDAEPQSTFIAIVSFCMKPFIKGSMIKMIRADLEAVKNKLEQAG